MKICLTINLCDSSLIYEVLGVFEVIDVYTIQGLLMGDNLLHTSHKVVVSTCKM